MRETVLLFLVTSLTIRLSAGGMLEDIKNAIQPHIDSGELAGAVSCAFSAICGETVLLDCGFEKSDNLRKWKASSDHFSYEEGIGEDATRALVWEGREVKDASDTFESPSFPVETGRNYRYTIKARSDADIVGRVYVHMCYRIGKKHVSVEGRPLVNNSWRKGRKWTEISGASGMVPPGATSGFVRISVMKKTTGRMVFDNLRITEGEKRYIMFLQSSAYRDCAVDGKVRFVASYMIGDSECAVGDRRPEFIVRGNGGGELKLPASTVEDGYFMAEYDVGSLAPGTNPIIARLVSADGREYDRMSIDFSRVAELPERKVYFDGHQRLIVGGKPFFALGMYGCGKTAAETDIYTNSAFNCTCVGNLDAFDRAEKRGLKVLFGAGRLAKANDEKFKKMVKDVGGREALLMWYTFDELPPGFVSGRIDLYNRLRKYDPHHPVYGVLDKCRHVRCFMPAIDCIMMDPYPVGNRKRGPIGICTEWPLKAADALFGMRPVMQVPQAFDWEWHRRKFNSSSPDHHFPTREEFRSMAWQPIALGVKGLVWYNFDWLLKESSPDEFKERWSYVRETVAEISRYSPVFLSVEPAPAAKSGNASVTARIWRQGGHVWLAAVNITDKRQVADVAVKGGSAPDAVKVEIGDAPKVSAGKLRFTLPPLGFSFVRWPADRR